MNAAGATAKQPILVTGAHRSGSTWVGKMLSAGPQVAYISEPLNVLHRPGVLRAPVRHWYTYICAENEAGYLPGLLETLEFRYHTLAEVRSLRSGKDLLRMARDGSNFLGGRLFRRRPLLKDPFAVFSSAWFAERLGCAVVFTVRHPAAFVSSLLRLDWPFDFADLLAQPLLVRDWLEPFVADLESMRSKTEDVIGQGSLLWRIIYHVVGELKDCYPQFKVVRHEDLSHDPQGGFRDLYASLGLDFTPKIQQAVARSSSSLNPAEVSLRKAHSVQLDSRANLGNWRRRLSGAEIERVRVLTAGVADRFYSAEDWK
jgi:hypothetical protein